MKNSEKQEKMQKLIKQILKFGVVGGISSVIDFGIYTVLIKVFGVNYLISGFFGFTISLIFNYIASMAFVFERKEGADKRKEFIVFTVLSVIGLGLTELIIWMIVEGYRVIPAIHFALMDQWIEVFGKLVATGIVMVYNFVTRKIFLEKKD